MGKRSLRSLFKQLIAGCMPTGNCQRRKELEMLSQQIQKVHDMVDVIAREIFRQGEQLEVLSRMVKRNGQRGNWQRSGYRPGSLGST